MSTSFSERIFARLVNLFPGDFRARFGDDMRDLFRDQLNTARARAGLRGVARLWMRTLVSLTSAALLEHRDTHRDTHRDARRLPVAPPLRRGDSVFDRAVHDLRFAARMLRKSPVFTVVAVLAISLGSGAVTTIFSAMNALLLRPLPGATDASRLVELELIGQHGHSERTANYLMYEQMRDRASTVAGLAAWRKVNLSIALGENAAVASGNLVSGNFFSVLGVRPALGRFFLPEETATPLTHPVIVVSHAFWQYKLGGDSGVVGHAVSVNGNRYTLVGVAPADFVGVVTPVPTDGWVPLMMQADILRERNLMTSRWLRLIARLKDNATLARAQAELGTLAAAADNDPATPDTRRTTGVRLATLRGIPNDAHNVFLGFMAILLGAAGLVLLIASVNVASLLSARVVARRREMAVRAALGAGRGRLVAQMLTEVLLLFALGAAGGVAFAFAATGAVSTVSLPMDVVSPPDMSPDLRVMAFALSVSLITGLVFGLVPAVRASRDDISARLRDGSAGAGSRRGFAGNALIVGQLALSLVLLVAAGLFLRALNIGARVNPGFERAGVSVAAFNSQTWGYDDAKGERFYSELRERIAAVPGVTDVAYASFAPLTTRSDNDSVTVDGGESLFTWLTGVDAGYFSAIHIPLVAGRAIQRSDDARAPRVAVINETLAKRLAPNGNALGRTLTMRGATMTVVGIVRDAKYASLAEDTPSMVYRSIDQTMEATRVMFIRTSVGAAVLGPALRDAMRAIDPAVPRPNVTTLESASGLALLPQRIAAIVTASLGGVGLLLATLGLYGIIAYSVNRRTREMGIRVALGARRPDVLGMVVKEGMRLAIAGVAIGLVLAAAASRLIAGYLFDVSGLDVATFASMSALFMVVTLVATYLPARRAAGADPMAALREDG